MTCRRKGERDGVSQAEEAKIFGSFKPNKKKKNSRTAGSHVVCIRAYTKKISKTHLYYILYKEFRNGDRVPLTSSKIKYIPHLHWCNKDFGGADATSGSLFGAALVRLLLLLRQEPDLDIR